ncbi:MAG TPA: NUDIX domain-containing protein [Candidatus Dormibacteraeota bacterium]|jgi:8-oxo-dGTP pyrophosphatase MutT (NUDIX family)|nr:NUDIX domain-containing protein [Candidatus Dormibacteraeota bacterium]
MHEERNGIHTLDPIAGDVLASLRGHHVADERERRSVRLTEAALELLPEPFRREAGLGHLTASTIVVSELGVLLHIHKRLGIWLQPGGHIDPGERPWDTALREAWEETGVAAVHPQSGPLLIHVDVMPAANEHVHYDVRYLTLAPPLNPKPPPGESPQVRWFEWDDAFAVADIGLAGALHAARRALDARPATRHRTPVG